MDAIQAPLMNGEHQAHTSKQHELLKSQEIGYSPIHEQTVCNKLRFDYKPREIIVVAKEIHAH
jgi:hypothetical protein